MLSYTLGHKLGLNFNLVFFNFFPKLNNFFVLKVILPLKKNKSNCSSTMWGKKPELYFMFDLLPFKFYFTPSLSNFRY